MEQLIFPFFVLVHSLIFGWSIFLLRRNFTPLIVLIQLMLVGMLYDNLIISLGRSLGAGGLLETLSWGRFILHSLGVPLMLLIGFYFLRHAQIKWANSPRTFLIGTLATVGMMAAMLSCDFARILKTADNPDSFRYMTDKALTPGWAVSLNLVIVSGLTIFMIVVGIVMGRKLGWWWLCATVGIIFVLNGAGASLSFGYILGNAGEIVLAIGFLATVRRIEPTAEPEPTLQFAPALHPALQPMDGSNG